MRFHLKDNKNRHRMFANYIELYCNFCRDNHVNSVFKSVEIYYIRFLNRTVERFVIVDAEYYYNSADIFLHPSIWLVSESSLISSRSQWLIVASKSLVRNVHHYTSRNFFIKQNSYASTQSRRSPQPRSIFTNKLYTYAHASIREHSTCDIAGTNLIPLQCDENKIFLPPLYVKKKVFFRFTL